MDPAEPSEISFEDAFRQLEETVASLEGGGLTIDDLVTRFEEGMSLVALCRRRLDTAQARISRLVREDDYSDSILDDDVESADA